MVWPINKVRFKVYPRLHVKVSYRLSYSRMTIPFTTPPALSSKPVLVPSTCARYEVRSALGNELNSTQAKNSEASLTFLGKHGPFSRLYAMHGDMRMSLYTLDIINKANS